jgi:GTP cyclohydrolase II
LLVKAGQRPEPVLVRVHSSCVAQTYLQPMPLRRTAAQTMRQIEREGRAAW